jgi:hypothetical protein
VVSAKVGATIMGKHKKATLALRRNGKRNEATPGFGGSLEIEGYSVSAWHLACPTLSIYAAATNSGKCVVTQLINPDSDEFLATVIGSLVGRSCV